MTEDDVQTLLRFYTQFQPEFARRAKVEEVLQFYNKRACGAEPRGGDHAHAHELNFRHRGRVPIDDFLIKHGGAAKRMTARKGEYEEQETKGARAWALWVSSRDTRR